LKHYRPFCFIDRCYSEERFSRPSNFPRQASAAFVIAILIGLYPTNIALAESAKLALQDGTAPQQAIPPNHGAAEFINSQHFEFEAWCRGSGKDMVYTWNGGEGNIPPHDQFGKSFIYPWLDTDILVRGVELMVLSPWWFVDWLAVGNNTWGDFMLLLGHGESHGANFFPGAAFRFPGKHKMTPLTYIDLHGSCWHPFKARVFLELYYAPAGDVP
jgi:hypothetical protein